jgi:hypothetical protein
MAQEENATVDSSPDIIDDINDIETARARSWENNLGMY